MNKEIYVYFDDAYTEAPALVGVLSAQQVRGREVFSFEFAGDWLHDSRCHLLDPDLQLFSGRQYLPESKSNFGLFLDSSPDRWGRVLLDRREGYRAREEQRPRRNLQESDYLLGVFDESRMGALRMKLDSRRRLFGQRPRIQHAAIHIFARIGERRMAVGARRRRLESEHQRARQRPRLRPCLGSGTLRGHLQSQRKPND